MLVVRTSRSTKDDKSFIRLHTSSNLEPEKLTQEIADLENELKFFQEQTKQLEESLKKSQSLLVKKDQANRRSLQEIEEKILGRNSNALSSIPNLNSEKIHEYHSEIQSKLGIVQYKTLQILVEQEKDLIREYKEQFISESENRAQLKKLLKSKRAGLTENMRNLLKYKKRVEKFERLDKENEFLVKKNMELKLDRTEQKKEILAMQYKFDELKLENLKLEKIKEKSRSYCRLPDIKAQTDRVLIVDKDSRMIMIDKLKQEIEEIKKINKEERLKLFRIQESSNEIKFILKKIMQDVVESIEKNGGKSLDKNKELVEKEKIVNKIYSITFPVKRNTNERTGGIVRPQMNDIESTMQQIQLMYENYEKDLKHRSVN